MLGALYGAKIKNNINVNVNVNFKTYDKGAVACGGQMWEWQISACTGQQWVTGKNAVGDTLQRAAGSGSCVRAPTCEAVTVHTSLGEVHGFTSMDDAPLTFAALEARIMAIPDGPSAELVTPRIMVRMNVVGTFGLVLGLMPSLLIHLMDPRMWMLRMAQIGLAITVIQKTDVRVDFLLSR